MPRGGHRPGAGAPKGNLNGLKHGRYSKHVHQLLVALNDIPEVRDIFYAYHRIHQNKVRKAKKAARDLFYNFLLQLPPQHDQKLNQTIEKLIQGLRRLQASPSSHEEIFQNPIILAKSNQN